MEATFDNKTNLLSANIRSSVDSSILYTITTSHNLWGRTITLLKDANPALGDSPAVGAIYWRERLFEVHGHRKSISDIKHRQPVFPRAQPRVQQQHAAKVHRRSQSHVSQKSNRDEKGKGGQGKEKDQDQEKVKEDIVKAKSAPQWTTCFPLVRRSSAILGQLGLVEWWRSMTCNTRFWRWSADRMAYEMAYHREQWQALAILDNSDDENEKIPEGRNHQGSTGSDYSDASGFDSDYEKVDEEQDERTAASLYIPYRPHLFHKTKPTVLRMGSAALLQDEVFLLLVMIYSETKRQDSTNSSGGW
ncbi:hypothetical protein P691DRAFT_809288 [Macrolepiota fuliginosa MF-IS2]|uniref:Uncharacterized protein n=1 Tax=Macrolepiota fuliginosa MF-IS2 TaxID=1400762 RepID=A0A9P5X4H6_9AGAR|nr:hypothetical protein P691DRAFT_809288 [Macrolepiota fuliginosa MF-IS2]